MIVKNELWASNKVFYIYWYCDICVQQCKIEFHSFDHILFILFRLWFTKIDLKVIQSFGKFWKLGG